MIPADLKLPYPKSFNSSRIFDHTNITAAKLADITLLFLGIDGTVENEMHDRTNISLPGVQVLLAQEIVANILCTLKLLDF